MVAIDGGEVDGIPNDGHDALVPFSIEAGEKGEVVGVAAVDYVVLDLGGKGIKFHCCGGWGV